MRKSCVWFMLFVMGICCMALQAEMSITTLPADEANYTTTGVDANIRSQYPDRNYLTGGLDIRNTTGSARISLPFFRFDLSSLGARNLDDAIFSFQITWSSKGVTRTYDIWGLNDGAGDRWDAGALNFNLANATTTPAASGGLEWIATEDSGTVMYGYYSVNETLWTKLGTVSFSVSSGGATPVISNTTNLNLNNFLAADTNGLVTLMLTPFYNGNNWHGAAPGETGTPDDQMPTLTFPHAWPAGPSNPSPADDDTITDVNLAQLCWKSFDVISYDVMFAAADPNLATKIATVTTDGIAEDVCIDMPSEVLPLQAPQTYYWYVTGLKYRDDDPGHLMEPNQVVTSPVWKFHTTIIPTLSENPVEAQVFANETASFTAGFECISPVTSAKWYKVGHGVPDQLVEGDRVTVTITPAEGNLYNIILDLADVVAADDGDYYCIASNNGFNSDPSGTAHLVVKRQIAHWTFDGNVLDETGVYNGTIVGEPNYVDSPIVQAMQFDGDNDAVNVPAGFDRFTAGFSCAFWAYPTQAMNGARFLELSSANGDNIYVGRVLADTSMEIQVWNATYNSETDTWTNAQSGYVNSGAGALALNEWQAFVITLDAARNVTIYKDGMPLSTGSITSMPYVVIRDLNTLAKGTAGALYKGQLDDVRIYNYGLSADEVGYLYSDIAGNYCRNKPAYDYDGSCVVDLADFAIFTGQWLECGMWPNCD